MSLIPLPWRLLGALVIALALFGGGYKMGDRNAGNACIAGQASAQQAAQAAANRESARRETIGAARETSREQIRIIYKTIKEKTDDYVKKETLDPRCGLDADGLRLWNAANSGSAEGLSGEPYLSLHRAASGDIGQSGGLVEQPHRGDGAVQPVPGQTGEAGGVPIHSPSFAK